MNVHPPRFLVRMPLALGAVVALPRDEAAHVRARRLRPGDAVALFDGAGGAFVGRVEGLARGSVTVAVTAARPHREHESPLALSLAVGLLKSDRIEWLIEKATELGVARLQPFASTHTVARPSTARRSRWQQIAAVAAKQCGRSALPDIAAPVDFAAVLAQPAGLRLLLAERGGTVDPLRSADAAPNDVQLIVGPEGGFAAAELEAALAAGCRLIDLGPRILRAETAALAAVALCQARWGDLGTEAERAKRTADGRRATSSGVGT